MVGSLQTLGFRPPVAAGSGIPRRRILSFPATRVRSHGYFLSPVAPPPLTRKPLQFLRLVAAGSDQVDASGNHDSNSREDFLWVRPLLDFSATNIIPIGVADYVDQNRRLFSLISAIFLSLVPWIQVSRSRSLLLTVKPTMFAIAICMGTLLHLILLAFNIVAVNSLSVVSGGNKSVFAKKQNARAVIIVASEKTLPDGSCP